MSSQTANLTLPLLSAAQAQKHVTHNEALLMLDSLVQLSLTARLTAPPSPDPAYGARYLVNGVATGAFQGHENAIAAFEEGGWRFLTPNAGWTAWLAQEARFMVFDGALWKDAPARYADMLGVRTTADTSNRLAVAGQAALFTHDGAGVQVKINKSAPTDTGSLLFQTSWSGRAEMGLAGDDNFHIKASPDGSAWKEALTIDRTSGAVSFPAGVANGGWTMLRNRLRNPSFAINQRQVAGVVTLAAGAYGHDGVKAGANGATYAFSLSGLDTSLTITAGSLILPIEDLLMTGEPHILTHEGTAPARIWQGAGVTGSGAYASAARGGAGLESGALNAAQQTNIEFSIGSVLRPQFEPGAATPFERRPPGLELFLCQRYFTVRQLTGLFGMTATPTDILFGISLPQPMRANPTILLLKTTINGSVYELLAGSTWVSSAALSLGPARFAANGGLVKVGGFSGLVPSMLSMGNAIAPFLSFSAEI